MICYMREIKFRVMTPKGWVRFGVYAGKPDVQTDAKTLGQFTGLKDKNDVEIYEEDIILTDNSILLRVLWWEDYPGFDARPLHDLEEIGDWVASIASTARVIGNIYENPELLNGK